jgi:hypothetical protein
VLEDFKRALARVQSDYGFYIGCQTNPTLALEGYALSSDERLALTNPEKLADVLKRGVGITQLRPITVKISGSHDWINRAVPVNLEMAAVEKADRDAKVAVQVDAIKRASTDGERTGATVRLMELIG